MDMFPHTNWSIRRT